MTCSRFRTPQFRIPNSELGSAKKTMHSKMRARPNFFLGLVFALLLIFFLNSTVLLNLKTITAYGEESYRFVRSWGGEGTKNGQFILPHSLAIDKSGNVYVTDTGNNRVEKFSSDGRFISEWGTKGTGDGQFVQ